jgi:hypothetical protein
MSSVINRRTSKMIDDAYLDAPIWGAKAIAIAANLFKDNAETGEREPYERKAQYLLETGVIAAKRAKGHDKDGKEKARGQWVTTLRLIRQSLLPGEAI